MTDPGGPRRPSGVGGRGCEVAVLGAGATGAAVTYALARRRIAIAVIDVARRDTSVPATAAMWVQGATPAESGLALRSAERFPAIQDELGPIGYRRTGGLIPALTEIETGRGYVRAEQAREAGLPVRWMSREEALRREPALAPGVIAASYCAWDGVVDAPRFISRLLAAAALSGTATYLDCGHVSVSAQPGGFEIRAGREELTARRLVICSGEMLRLVGRQVDLDLPLRVSRPLAFVTERVRPLLRHIVDRVRQHATGEFCLDSAVGDESPLDGPAAQDAPGFVEALRRTVTAAVRVVPALESARILYAPGRTVVEPADGRPAVGRLDERIYVALPTSDHEISSCPVVGETLAEAVSRGRAPEGLDFWAPRALSPAGTPGGHPGEDSTNGP